MYEKNIYGGGTYGGPRIRGRVALGRYTASLQHRALEFTTGGYGIKMQKQQNNEREHVAEDGNNKGAQAGLLQDMKYQQRRRRRNGCSGSAPPQA